MIFKFKIFFSFFLITSLCFCESNKYTVFSKSDIVSTSDSIFKVKFPIKGISFVASDMVVDQSHLLPIKNLNANWICQMPFAYCPRSNSNSPELIYNATFQWWGETDRGIVETTKIARNNKIKVLLKPQLWLHGNYTGHFTLSEEKDWKIWEKCYSDYIYHFAHLADSLNIEMFCIGTELKQTIVNRPDYWNHLIDSIKTFYEGELTYAANWDDFQEVHFWNKLDYIGIDGYFPLSNSTTPTVEELCQSWKSKIAIISEYQAKKNKPVLFTEIGYKSVSKCAEEPWNPTSKDINLQAQQNATEAFLKSFADIDWFKGCFIWKWYPDDSNSGGQNDGDYTPQNKPSIEVFRKNFKN
jgi:hypothetical protein